MIFKNVLVTIAVGVATVVVFISIKGVESGKNIMCKVKSIM